MQISADGGIGLGLTVLLLSCIASLLLLAKFLQRQAAASPGAPAQVASSPPATAAPAPQQPAPARSQDVPWRAIAWIVAIAVVLGLLWYWGPFERLDRMLDERDRVKASATTSADLTPTGEHRTQPRTAPVSGWSEPVDYHKGFSSCMATTGPVKVQLRLMDRFGWVDMDSLPQRDRDRAYKARFQSASGKPEKVEVSFVPYQTAC